MKRKQQSIFIASFFACIVKAIQKATIEV